jgi:hypothetical protein
VCVCVCVCVCIGISLRLGRVLRMCVSVYVMSKREKERECVRVYM